MKYLVMNLGPWMAVVRSDITPAEADRHWWLAEALCADRRDAHAIAKRLNAERRKAARR